MAAGDIVKSIEREDQWFAAGSTIPDWNDEGRNLAWDAIAALIAWDDCAYMLDSNPGELAIIAALGDPRAILLLPACTIFSKEKDLV